MAAKKIVITGGPGSGKTTLVQELERKGYFVEHEVSRDVIKEAQELGIEQLFLEDPILFSDKLLVARLKQFTEKESVQDNFIFYDRALPDVVAYMDFAGIKYPEYFIETCSNNIYDFVFILPPWQEIYLNDNERYESFEEAEKIYEKLKKTYANYGYKSYSVPVGPLEERLNYILNELQKTF